MLDLQAVFSQGGIELFCILGEQITTIAEQEPSGNALQTLRGLLFQGLDLLDRLERESLSMAA